MSKGILIILLAMFLSGCTTVRSNGIACPDVKKYSKEEQKALHDELQTTSLTVQLFIKDYLNMRDESRLCLGLTKP